MSTVAPKVTVLALSYNHADYLVETLESIRCQSFQDFELFISDDASRDDSATLIQEWNARHQRADRLFLHATNQGLCPTLNEMFEAASGQYLQLIACDDHLLPQCLQRKVAVLDSAGSNVAAVYSDAIVMDDNGQEQPRTFLEKFLKKRPAPEGNLFPRLLLGNFLPAMSVLSRREFVQQVGAFDNALLFEDWDLWLRLGRHYDFVYDNQPSVRYRIHQANMHRNMSGECLQNYRILAKHRDMFRARMRILLTIVRNADDFSLDTAEVQDFLTWADSYPETRWFRRAFFGRSRMAQQMIAQLVDTSEGVTRPFSAPENRRLQKTAA
ncbi:MAG: glycosyltransferase [Fuerstiella sp.]